MKKFDLVNYIGCDWRYIGKESEGIRLMSTNKNVSDIVVAYSREMMIKPTRA